MSCVHRPSISLNNGGGKPVTMVMATKYCVTTVHNYFLIWYSGRNIPVRLLPICLLPYFAYYSSLAVGGSAFCCEMTSSLSVPTPSSLNTQSHHTSIHHTPHPHTPTVTCCYGN